MVAKSVFGRTAGLATLVWQFSIGLSMSLAIQYWPLYVIVNEKEKTIADCWDGVELKFSFRRTVSAQMMQMWEEILGLASSIHFIEDQDSVIWEFNTNGIYSVQSLYVVMSFRGCSRSIPLWCGAC